MDIVAHGLWSGAIYNKKRAGWAIFFGVAPDLFSFGLLIALHLLVNGLTPIAFTEHGVPRPEFVPPFVHSLYNVTHSLIIWGGVFTVAALYLKRVPWEFTAWALHILIDIPTHSTSFFPTPFLWPLPQPFVNGVSWATPWFFLINYAGIAVVYGWLYVKWLKKSWNQRRARPE